MPVCGLDTVGSVTGEVVVVVVVVDSPSLALFLLNNKISFALMFIKYILLFILFV